jgi:hypothetical protein
MTSRWLDRDALAAHISVRPDAIARLQKAGRLPVPSYHLGPRQPRWDRDAVDAALNGGVASTDPNLAVQSLVNEILASRKGRPQASG